MDSAIPSKLTRTLEFHRRLAAAPAAADFTEAFEQICLLLNQVEDEMISIPFDPLQWKTDGRMYPPQEDRLSIDPSRSDVFVLQSRKHSTQIYANGAIEIRDSHDQIVFSKRGFDGRSLGETAEP